jgi:hypothetical protein
MPPLLAPALISLGVSSSVAGPLSSILFTGLSIALSIIFAPDVPKPDSGRIPFKQAIPDRIFIRGQRRTSGAIMLFEAVKGRAHVVQALCEGEANEFLRHYFHDDRIEVDGSGFVDFGADDGRYGENRAFVEFRYGMPTETAYDEAVTDIGNTAVWSYDHRGDGICSSHCKFRDAGSDEQGKRFPFGLPSYSAAIDVGQPFDPRDVDHDITDRTTWTWSAATQANRNPIIQAMALLTDPIELGGMGLDLEESFGTVLAEVSAQADICDDLITNKSDPGPSQTKRYQCDAYYTSHTDPGEVLAAILGSGDCFCAERGDGAFELKSGLWDAEDFEVVITDRHIISLNVRRFKPDEDEVTGVIVKYLSPDHEYAEIDAPVWPRDAYQGGNDHRVRTIDVTFCSEWHQAQRLAKRVAVYEMAPVTGTAVLTMWGMQLFDRRGATIQCSDDPALEDCKVRLTRVEPNLLAGTVEIDFQVFDPDEADAWDAATEEGPRQPVVDSPDNVGLSTPTDVNPVAYQVGSTVNVDVSFNAGTDTGDNINVRVRWRLADVGGSPGPWSYRDFSPGQIDRDPDELIPPWIVTLANMPSDVLQIGVMQYRSNFSAWSGTATTDTTILSPDRPTEFTAVLNGADVDLAWRAPASANMHHARVYRATTGAGFGLASDISGELLGSPSEPMTYTDTAPGSGGYDYWVVAENVTDVASLPRGPETVTVP